MRINKKKAKPKLGALKYLKNGGVMFLYVLFYIWGEINLQGTA